MSKPTRDECVNDLVDAIEGAINAKLMSARIGPDHAHPVTLAPLTRAERDRLEYAVGRAFYGADSPIPEPRS